MQSFRPVFALHPARFGRGVIRLPHQASEVASKASDDLKLFAATFLAGFLFVSILIG